MHHDKDFAVNRNGTQDIFLNTPNLAAWFERYITDWTGPYGRLRRVTFRMLGSIFPGDTMVFRGTVTETGVDDTGCGWVALDIAVSVDGDTKTTCTARVALPARRRRQPVVPLRRPLDAVSPDRPTPTRTDPAPRTRRRTTRGEHDMLDLTFSPEQEMLRETVRGVVATTSPLERGARARGRPDRLLARAVEAAGPPRPHRAAAARGVRGLGHDRPSRAWSLYEEFGRALAPSPHFVSSVLSGGALARSGSAEQKQAWLPAHRLRRGHPHPGLAGAGEQLGPDRRPGAGRARRRRVDHHRDQAPRGLRLVGRPAGRAGPHRRRRRRTSTSSWSTRPADGVTLTQQMTIGSDAQYRVELDGVRVTAADRIGAAGHRVGHVGRRHARGDHPGRRPGRGRGPVRPRHHRPVRQGPPPVRQAARRLPGPGPLPGRRAPPPSTVPRSWSTRRPGPAPRVARWPSWPPWPSSTPARPSAT